jgi:hypothetical protein
MTTALSKQEAADLRACEQIIMRGIKTFREVGMALAKVRDERLYRQEYKTFGDFCTAKMGVAKSHAYRLIAAAGTPAESPTGDAIDTEHKAREYIREQKQAVKPEPKAVVAELDFGDEESPRTEPVSGDTDDCTDAAADVPDAAAQFLEWLRRVVRQRWDNDNGDLTLVMVANELFFLSEEVPNWT